MPKHQRWQAHRPRPTAAPCGIASASASSAAAAEMPQMQTVIIMSYGKASVWGVRNVHGKRDTVSGLHRDRRLTVWH